MINNFFFSENRTVCEIMWKNVVERGRAQMTIWRMHIACWIPKATNTHSAYAITIALPPQQRLHARVSMSRSTYIVCLAKLLILHYILNVVNICNKTEISTFSNARSSCKVLPFLFLIHSLTAC